MRSPLAASTRRPKAEVEARAVLRVAGRRVAAGCALATALLTLAAAPAMAGVTVAGAADDIAGTAPPTLLDYTGFTNPSDTALSLTGSAQIVPPTLRLVDPGTETTSGGAWYVPKVEVAAGWQTRFGWQLSSGAGDSPEGLAFVIQNEGPTARGAAAGGLGFDGIANSVAVAIGTTQNASLAEPPEPFISVQTRGALPNSASFNYSLGSATASSLADGAPHTITVRYLPPNGTPGAGLTIWLDDAAMPILSLPTLDLAGTLALPDGTAWIGFTAANGTSPNLESADIDSWSFGPPATPAGLAITSAPVSGTATSHPTLGPIAVALEDADGNPIVAPSAVDVALRSDSTGSVFAAGAGGSPVSAVTIQPGRSSTVFFYGDTVAASPTITATADGLAAATQSEAITAGTRAGIGLTPTSASITAGGSQTYAVHDLDAYGNVLGTDEGATLAISPDGSCTGNACTARVAGPHTVTATDGDLVASAGLTVEPGPAAALALSPAGASIAAGGSQSYAVEAVDAYGNVGDQVDGATLTIGPDGSCSGNACTATVAGSHTVTATAGQLKGTATLTVTPGPLASLALSPSSASVTAGQAQDYTVEAFDRFGNDRGKDGDASLEITPDGNCSGGACTAFVAGPHTVRAVDGGFVALATLTVDPGPAASLALSPGNASIAAGATQSYAAHGVDAYGNPVPTADATLAISPDGSCTTNACTATVAGSHTVTATAGQLKGTATLTVTPGPLASLRLSPASASITAGKSQTYTVLGSDAFGNPVPKVDATVAISPDGSCSGDVCTATVPGTHTVTATAGEVTGSATLVVEAPDTTPPATAIALDPTDPDGDNGWYVSTVHATVSAADGADGSGVSELRCVLDPPSAPASYADLPAGCDFAGTGADIRSDGHHVLYAAAKDAAGNAGTPVKQALALDATAPTVKCAAAPTFVLHAPDADVAASVADATSGPARTDVSVAADTSAVGTRTATLTGADSAGNRTTISCAYTVRYAFDGFFAPIDNLDAGGRPVLNVVKAGRLIPLRWRLTDAAGAPVTDLSAAQVTTVGIACDTGSTLDPVEETSAGTSALQNLGDGNYQLNWKSSASYANSCRRLRLDLAEGNATEPIYHTADFEFTH